jgi:hypothetical protein
MDSSQESVVKAYLAIASHFIEDFLSVAAPSVIQVHGQLDRLF